MLKFFSLSSPRLIADVRCCCVAVHVEDPVSIVKLLFISPSNFDYNKLTQCHDALTA